jgi:hypothetical protein
LNIGRRADGIIASDSGVLAHSVPSKRPKREVFFFADDRLWEMPISRICRFRAAFVVFAFGFRALGRLTLVGFFGEGRALRRACFLE